jgi:hypothetical protein
MGRSAVSAAVGVAEGGKAVAGRLLLRVDALGVSLRRSQRDPDFRSEIIYVPVNHNVCLGER